MFQNHLDIRNKIILKLYRNIAGKYYTILRVVSELVKIYDEDNDINE